MTDQPDRGAIPVEDGSASRGQGTPARPWYLIPLVPAFGLFALSFLGSRIDTPDGLREAYMINFLLMGPLWAATAFLYYKGKTRLVMAIAAFLLPAAGLSLFQAAVTHARSFIPADARTRRTMETIGERIQAYVAQHQQVPPSLSSLPAPQNAFEKPVDGWGHAIHYTVEPDGAISLVSHGEDGKPGGDGEDSDLLLKGRTRHVDGKLVVDQFSWKRGDATNSDK